MTKSVSRSRGLLVCCLAGAGLALAASPASADIYELQYQTPLQNGDIFFYGPAPSLILPPGALIASLVPDGSVIPSINGGAPIYSTVSVNGGDPTNLTGVVGSGAFNASGLFWGPGNVFGGINDNLLLSFTNSNGTTPPSSSLDNTWFSPGGIAFQLADGTQINLFTNGSALWSESVDASGFPTGDSQGFGLLIDYAPGPTPGAGFLGLVGLALGAAALKLRERHAR